MNERVKKIWLEALRSGEYKKGVGCLRDNQDRFCCLGVLCDLYANEHPDEGTWEDSGEITFRAFHVDGRYSTQVLPGSVVSWAGLEDYNPGISPINVNGKQERCIAGLNDCCDTFDEVIQIIEDQL